MTKAAAGGGGGTFLLFELASGAPANGTEQAALFGLDATSVLQVFEPDAIWPVPLAPRIILGILNFHGRIVTVIDPAPILGLAPQPLPVAQGVLLRRGQRATGHVGLQVVRTREMVPVQAMEPVDVPCGACVSRTFRFGRRLVHIVDVELLLDQLGRQFSAVPSLEARQGVRL